MRVAVLGLIGLLAAPLAGCGGRANTHRTDGSAGMAAVPECTAGVARCDESGLREECLAGSWQATQGVCTTAVSVDDETGNYCATKADGQYRCWGKAAAEATPLPPADYARVQLTASGLIGLKKDGSFAAAGPFQVPPDTPKVSDFHATNMFGNTTMCMLDGQRFTMVFDGRSGRPDKVAVQEGRFNLARCAFEGLFCGVLTDGQIDCFSQPAPEGAGWQSLSLTWTMLCALDQNGAVVCSRTGAGCNFGSAVECNDYARRYSPGKYTALASTISVVCTLDTNAALLCMNLDGDVLVQHAGPFRSLAAGFDTVCALLQTGKTVCYQQDPPGVGYDGTDAFSVKQLLALPPSDEEDF